MNTGERARRHVRRGMILPLVLIGMLLMLTFSASLQQVAWRAARGARATWDAQRGLYLAEAAIVEAIAEWFPDSVAISPIGQRVIVTSSPMAGWRTRRSIVRTAPLTAVVHAVAQRSWSTMLPAADVPPNGLGDAARVRRSAMRVVHLEPPALPILAAATVLGRVTLGTADADGRDRPLPFDPRRDDCGPLRDSASVDAIAAAQFIMLGAPSLSGAAVTLTPGRLAVAHARFDQAFAQLQARARSITPAASGAMPAMSDWRAVVMDTTGSVTLTGSSSHVGLLAVNGDLILRGRLRVEGLLVVRGAVDASAGALDVLGALVVRDASAVGSTLGAGARVRYAPCLAGRALVAVAVPRPSVFGAWNSP